MFDTQVANEINARRINDEYDIFSGFFTNWIFLAVIAITMGAQAIIINFLGLFFKVRLKLNRARCEQRCSCLCCMRTQICRAGCCTCKCGLSASYITAGDSAHVGRVASQHGYWFGRVAAVAAHALHQP